jgi:nucleoside-diphosphate-sugar epimerase
MRVLLTGHLGYIGSLAAPILRQAGHTVTGCDSGFFRDCGVADSHDPVPDCGGDVRDVTSAALQGVEAVVHLAALCNDPLGDIDPSLTMAINHHASVRLARLAREAGVRRFVFASSCSLYGASGTDDAVHEGSPLRPLTPYAESKARTEEALSRLADAWFSPVYLRNATAYGMSPRLRGDVVLNNLVGWACTTGTIRLASDGMAWRPLIHAEDIARACAACLDAPREAIHDQAYNIGSDDENFRVRDLAELVREIVPGSRLEYRSDASDARSYRVDFSKARRFLPAFAPRWRVHEGASEVYRALRAHAIDRETYFSRRFVRLAQVRWLRESSALNGDLRWIPRHHVFDDNHGMPIVRSR